MASSSIQPLPAEVIAQIKSSIVITSLNDVAIELVKNSLDAASHKIDLSVDYSRGACTVEDDGQGILPSDFYEEGGLGKPYHTSKLKQDDSIHGSRGTFLASLAALSMVSITSHHHAHRSHNALTLHRSQVINRQIPASSHAQITALSHGTRVAVRDLFGTMPVRVKQRPTLDSPGSSGREWEELKRRLIGLLIAWPSAVSVTLRDAVSGQRLGMRPSSDSMSGEGRSRKISVPRVCGILSQAGLIVFSERDSWVSTSASSKRVAISAAICLVPYASKHVQFISTGIRHLSNHDGHNAFYEAVNRLFADSAFGIEDVEVELDDVELERRSKDRRYKSDGFTNKELKGRKGVDRWPMFYINIMSNHHGLPNGSLDLDDNVSSASNRDSGHVLEVLQAMILEFLQHHNFRPRARRSQVKFARSTDIKGMGRPRPDSDFAGQSLPSKSSISKSMELGTGSGPEEQLDSVYETTKPAATQKMASTDIVRGSRNSPIPRSMSADASPFHYWSRIKSGRPTKPLPSLAKDKSESRSRSASTGFNPQSPHSSSFKDTNARGDVEQKDSSVQRPTCVSMIPTLDKSGKVIRAPFQDVAKGSAPKTKSSNATPYATPQPEEASSYDDDLAIWINPITKVRSIVNKRTGLAAPARNETRMSRSTTQTPTESSGYERKRLTTGLTSGSKPSESSAWLRNVLAEWNNPIFNTSEMPIQRVTLGTMDAENVKVLHGHRQRCSQSDVAEAFKNYSSSEMSSRLSKEALCQAEIISQVDRKFILTRMRATSTTVGSGELSGDQDMLVLVDQHAADERCRVESLFADLTQPLGKNNSARAPGAIARSIVLEKQLAFDVSLRELKLLRKYSRHLANWGIIVDLPAESSASRDARARVAVLSLPRAISERCKLEPRLLIELVRSEIWGREDAGGVQVPRARVANESQEGADGHDWLNHIHDCPKGIVDMVNSRACRGAIMFNDELSHEQCQKLLSRLAHCAFPFQCAHGRPSMIPLVDLGTFSHKSGGDATYVDPGPKNFGIAFKQWKETMSSQPNAK